MDALLIVSAFMMQVGARHIAFDMTDGQRKLMQHPYAKGLVLFSMFFFTTRSALFAGVCTLAYFLMAWYLMNETSKYNLISRPWLVENGFMKREYFEDSPISTYRKSIEELIFA
jgi:cellulose synthase/poly-beta-1,6-N-acetylglucosamine synthase-like glycosyltransferase